MTFQAAGRSFIRRNLILSAAVIAAVPIAVFFWSRWGYNEEPLRSADQLRVPSPSQKPVTKGGGIQPLSLAQTGVSDGPGIDINPNPSATGNAEAGKGVFRFETFGNEGFWTDALRWLEGIKEAKVTPLNALQAGMLINTEMVEPALLDKLSTEARTDYNDPAKAPLLNDPAIFLRLLEMNAVVGVPSKSKSSTGHIDLVNGDGKIGVSCAICHSVTDKSVLEIPRGGSIGRVVDGPAALVFNMGQFIAWGANSRAYYPNTQIAFPGGVTIGRAPKGLSSSSTEAEFKAYLTNPAYYPVGTFDETQDGIGNSVVNMPLFRQDLAAPYGTSAEFRYLDDISNGSYTQNLDPTGLTSPEGRAFLWQVAGPLGVYMREEYKKILRETGVEGFPYVHAALQGEPGKENNKIGRRVDETKLRDMSAYLMALPAPAGAPVDPVAFRRGREVFRGNCTACHNVDQSKPVPPLLVDLKQLWPGYKPIVLLPREAPLTPVQNAPGGFDDKLVIADGSPRGDPRGIAIPLLLDLARKERFLHDASVFGMESLFNPTRGSQEPHPFYIAKPDERADLIAFIKGMDINTR